MANPASTASGNLVTESMTHIATTANKQRKLLIVGGVVVLAATLAASLYLSKRNTFRAAAADALFHARSKLADEMKALAPAPAPIEKDAKGKAKPAAPVPSMEFAKFDVDSKLKEGVAALQKVAEDFPATLAGYDSKMELGALYFDHAENPAAYERALRWFEAAGSSASTTDQTIASLYSLGYTQEALDRCADAVKTFDRALNSGSGPFLGELLRAKGRCQEKLADKAGAKATYDSLIKQLPGTEHAKFAEMKKASL